MLEESQSKQHWRNAGLAPVQGLSAQAEDKEQNRGILGKQNNRIIRDSEGGCGTVAASLPFWAPRVAFIGSRCLRPTVQPRCSSAATPLNLKTLSDWTRRKLLLRFNSCSLLLTFIPTHLARANTVYSTTQLGAFSCSIVWKRHFYKAFAWIRTTSASD